MRRLSLLFLLDYLGALLHLDSHGEEEEEEDLGDLVARHQVSLGKVSRCRWVTVSLDLMPNFFSRVESMVER